MATETDLDEVEVDLPVVTSSGGDESVSILVFLGRVHWSYLLPGHSRLQTNMNAMNVLQSSDINLPRRMAQCSDWKWPGFLLEAAASAVFSQTRCP